MKVIYRISDSGYSKIKPYYVKNRNVFLHFLTVFKHHEIYVIADNVRDDTYAFLIDNIDTNKSPKVVAMKTSSLVMPTPDLSFTSSTNLNIKLNLFCILRLVGKLYR